MFIKKIVCKSNMLYAVFCTQCTKSTLTVQTLRNIYNYSAEICLKK